MTQWFLGLDLGQTTDYTALTVLGRTTTRVEDARGQVVTLRHYDLPHVERFALGTKYTDIVRSVCDACAGPPFDGEAVLAIDQTGVGRPGVEMFLQAGVPARVLPITITAGHSVTGAADGGIHVPKKELVMTLQVIFQSRRVRIAKRLPLLDVMLAELENFRVKITLAANETFGAHREGANDDIILAAALAAWAGEKYAGPYLGPLVLNERVPWPGDDQRGPAPPEGAAPRPRGRLAEESGPETFTVGGVEVTFPDEERAWWEA